MLGCDMSAALKTWIHFFYPLKGCVIEEKNLDFSPNIKYSVLQYFDNHWENLNVSRSWINHKRNRSEYQRGLPLPTHYMFISFLKAYSKLS